MIRYTAAAIALTIGIAGASIPAYAGSYTLNCVDATTGQATTVTVDANSRSDAIKKVRNDPAYSNYDKCK